MKDLGNIVPVDSLAFYCAEECPKHCSAYHQVEEKNETI